MQALLRGVEKGGVLSFSGTVRPAFPFLASLLHRQFPERPILVVTDGLKSQEQFEQDFGTWLAATSSEGAEPQVLFFQDWEILPGENKLPHADVISDRLRTLVSLRKHASGRISADEGERTRLACRVRRPAEHSKTLIPPNLSTESKSAGGGLRRDGSDNTRDACAPVVIANVVALQQSTFEPKGMEDSLRALRRGDRVGPLDLVEWLEDSGYEPEAQVTQKGEIALRGGIVDVFPPTSPWPVRLEFFGDELESLREFDPQTQMSRDAIESITLPPAGELGLLKRAFQNQADETAAKSQPRLGTLLDYLPGDTILILCEPDELEKRATDYSARTAEGDPFHNDWGELVAKALSAGMCVLELSESEGDGRTGFQPVSLIERNSESQCNRLEACPTSEDSRKHADTSYSSFIFQTLDTWRPLADRPPEPQVAEMQRREFFNQLHRWLRQGFDVRVFCNNDGERQRFREVWNEYGLGGVGRASNPSHSSTQTKSQRDGLEACPTLMLGSLSRGFICGEAKLVVVTDAEIFGRYKVQRPRRMKSPHATAAHSLLDINFAELEPGDYVVHLQHGIGRYQGLQSIGAAVGKSKAIAAGAAAPQEIECLVIEYAAREPDQPPPKLYVPVSEAHLVSKYVGAGKARPALNTLGGARWAKTKEQAEKSIRDLAAELLAVQAARESLAGHSFSADTSWQREFESAFLYEETPDQLRAIGETKADLERAKPMDRLICGDVGFGKTEVAIRAAFKAVMGGKQVAVLVPTTVLAQQHYNNFRDRMADYPVRIELLSRFRTRRQQDRVVQDLAHGAVDIVIGTHRLVQEDVAFKDLGLVVIDEEQRFGVMHKEKFKQLRKLVDVLTLSATPIPRTLYLALTGARDMSTIQTPPHDRLPVETIVTDYDERLIRDVIQRELNRGGQVFFLHNRVMTIDLVADKLKTLLPEARIVVGHGQMHADDLEEVMTRFINGEAEVLLSTTIIESGLDIPNANTIIIDRADRFGLSELYQLRGRVGRYKHQAYAYLLLPRHARLLTDVRKRMSTMKQYSQLGSGFKIAMRDLEIRGAGNLLGSQQSGHITAVGFELYCQLLKQSIASLKGEKVKARVEVTMRLDFMDVNATGNSPNGAHGVTRPTAAGLPSDYIPEPQHRIDIYRKLAQVTDKESLAALKAELRDRFGPLPSAVELLLLAAELKFLASDRQITVVETKEDKLMLTRHGDFIQLGGRFPRLTKKSAEARLKEIRKLLLAIH